MAGALTRAIYFRLLETDAELLMARASNENVGVQKFVKKMVLDLIHDEGSPANSDVKADFHELPRAEPAGLLDDVLTLDEAAAYLRVTPGALAAWLKAGRAPGRPFGEDDWRLSRGGLLKWLASSTSSTSSAERY
jgi:hypothetical protein